MAKPDLGKFKKQLQTERERLLLEHRIMAATTTESTELTDYDNHPADMASETYERTKDFALDENFRDIIEQIDNALSKIKKGSYGRCDRCGIEIKHERLRAIPYASFCIECQEIIERR